MRHADPEFLLAAIRTVHARNAVIAASAARELFEHFTPAGASSVSPAAFRQLTARERDTFPLAAWGLSNAEIASGEYLSEETVKTQISRILGKLSLRDQLQLVVVAFENGLNTWLCSSGRPRSYITCSRIRSHGTDAACRPCRERRVGRAS